jgi:hypothetical protein
MNRWEYLLTPAFQTRYVLAAHYVKDCPVVVEVGGWKNCIADYLDEHHTVVTIDPLAEPRVNQASVNCIKKSLQDVDTSFLKAQDFGLVFLGFELVGERSNVAMDKLVSMVNQARTVVLEYSIKHSPSGIQANILLGRCNKQIYLKTILDLSGNNLNLPADSFPPFYERMFMVMRDNV